MKTTIILSTNGSGLWSRIAKSVVVTGLDCVISKMDDEDEPKLYGELCVRFDTASWNTNEHGLIYTDKQFLKGLHNFLKTQGFTAEAAEDVSYSEQGMQGDEYVSLDVSSKFCEEWMDKYPETEVHEF